jgi:poly(A) polymerase
MLIPKDTHYKTAVVVLKTLRGKGFTAYFAGGCVRDMVMGTEPHDYDIATNARPAEIEKTFKKTLSVGRKFGVIIVLEKGFQFEVATFRTDGTYTDGRHPDAVSFGTAQQDALRRDFTVNALFFDPVKEEVLDHVEGAADIQARVLRTVGDPDTRFAEDYLRMMRAVRFAFRLGFRIDPPTYKAIQKHAPSIQYISAERIKDEFDKILVHRDAGKAFRCLHDSGLLRHTLPEVDAMEGVPQPEQFHPEGDVFEHTMIMLDLMEAPSRALAYSVLLHDVGKPPTLTYGEDRIRFNCHDKVGENLARTICSRLRFPKDMTKKVVHIIGNHMRFMHVRQMKQAKLKRLMAQETFSDELELHRLDCLASHGDISNWEFLTRAAQAFQDEKEEILTPLITGKDLIALGYTPGPLFSTILRSVEDARFEKVVTTKKQAIAHVKKHFQSHIS